MSSARENRRHLTFSLTLQADGSLTTYIAPPALGASRGCIRADVQHYPNIQMWLQVRPPASALRRSGLTETSMLIVPERCCGPASRPGYVTDARHFRTLIEACTAEFGISDRWIGSLSSSIFLGMMLGAWSWGSCGSGFVATGVHICDG